MDESDPRLLGRALAVHSQDVRAIRPPTRTPAQRGRVLPRASRDEEEGVSAACSELPGWVAEERDLPAPTGRGSLGATRVFVAGVEACDAA